MDDRGAEGSAARAALVARGWTPTDDGRAVTRTFVFVDFAACFAFMTAVAAAAEELAHHPDWSQAYGTLTVRLTTHDAGGLTARDVALADAITARWAACQDVTTPTTSRT